MEWGWVIWIFIVGGILCLVGLALMRASALDGFSAALIGSGVICVGVGMAVLIGIGISAARGRDLDGRFAQSPLKPWFDSLKSGKGPCCSDADGTALSDVDWETRDGHYRVRIKGKWYDVPDNAVITEPNRYGRTMVWPIPNNDYRNGESIGYDIRCFMPGSMT